MKHFKRMLAMLLAAVLLCGTMSALADAGRAPGAARVAGNADEAEPMKIYRAYTLNVGERKQIIRNQSSSTGRFDVTLTCSDPKIVEIKSKRVIQALAPGKCIVTATIVPDWRKDKPVVQNYEITVVGGPMLAANGKLVEDDDIIRMKVRKPFRVEVKYLNLLRIKSWSSSDSRMLKIVTKRSVCSFIPLRPGLCTITVRFYGGQKLSCKVLVTA